MKKNRGFEIAKGWEDKDIHLPIRKTAHSAGYDVEAAEDIVIPKYFPGIKPTLIPTGLKAYCGEDECYYLLIDSDYYENPDNDGHFYFAYFNCSDHDIKVKKGDIIGQVVFSKYLVCDGDRATGKRKGGFGSTD